MSQLQRRFVQFVTVVMGCTLLRILLSTHYKQLFKVTKGDNLTHGAANNISLKYINIIYGNNVILNHKSHDVSFSPETRLHTLCDQLMTTDKSKITSTKYSEMKFSTLNNDGTVIVLIHTYDMLNRVNTRGDDVIVIWAEEKDGDGRVSGEVIDNKNGSYTGILKLFWSGPTTIKAKLASSIINTCLRMKAIKKYGNAVFAMQKIQGFGIRGSFENERHKEISSCGANPTIFGYTKICNLTSINGGMPWYCGQPKSLSCSDIHSFEKGNIDTRWASHQERIQDPGHGVFRSTVTISVPLSSRCMSEVPCKYSPSTISWENNAPSGYWLDDAWHMTQFKSEIKRSFADYRECLRGKTIIFIGDSTLRQYASFILKHIMGIDSHFKQESVGIHNQYHNFSNMFIRHGISLRYLKHEMPFHNEGLTSFAIQSTPQLLDGFALRNISDLIVVVNYDSHYTAYPPHGFRHCQRELSKALKRLNVANPSARLFVKKPHLVIYDWRWFDPHIELLGTEMLREEFADMHDKVILLDPWTISVAHNSELLHPEDKALQSQMHQFISYLC